MRTEYALLHRSGQSYTSEQVGPRYTAVDEARTAAGHPDAGDWYRSPSGSVVLTDAARQRSGYENDLPWILSEQQVPETDAERIRLATELLLEYGQTDGDHHKAWVIDQTLRLLTGDRYEQVIDDYSDGEAGPATYVWDEGIAPCHPDLQAVLTAGTRVFATDAFGDELPGVITRGPWRGKRTEFLKVTVRFDPDARDHRGIGGGATVPWPVEFVRPVASTATKADKAEP